MEKLYDKSDLTNLANLWSEDGKFFAAWTADKKTEEIPEAEFYCLVEEWYNAKPAGNWNRQPRKGEKK